MAHPQLLAQLLGGAFPPQPGELGAADMPDVARPVEPRDRHQATEARCLAGVCGFPGACGHLCFWAGDDVKGRGEAHGA